MNPKSALFVSAALTTFVLAILAGVVTQINSPDTQAAVEATEAPIVTEAPVIEIASAPTATVVPQPTPITPEQAAAIAAKVMNNSDLYSVETTMFDNAQAYLVTFSSGDLVTIGLDGQVLLITQPTAIAVVSNYTYIEPTPAASTSNDSGNYNPASDLLDKKNKGDDHDDDDDDD